MPKDTLITKGGSGTRTAEDLERLQALPLVQKINLTYRRIEQWYKKWDGQVYVAFSGGKDSTVLLHLVRSLYPEVEAVFSNTGLEYPELVEHVKKQDNVTVVRPEMSFKQVLETKGYPVVSKENALKLRQLQTLPKDGLTYKLRTTGVDSKGNFHRMNAIPKKWAYLEHAPFKISEQCCDVMKKKPMKKFSKVSGKKAITGTMAGESRLRKKTWLQRGCNIYDGKDPVSNPMAFWTEQDVLQYLTENNLNIPSVYGEIVQDLVGNLELTGVQRTGCIFCVFGCHMEKGENRFQKLKKSHPQLHKYCMETLGMREVLEYLNVPWE